MKIGLLAMSGIRVCDKELLAMGLTLPGFVERSKTIASLPSLGLLTLAGMTPKEHHIQYVDVPDANDFNLDEYDFDFVAISSYSAQIDEAYDLGLRYKAQGIPVAIGGPHVSALPDEAKQYCTSVVIGEGELSWLKMLGDLKNGGLKESYGSLDASFDMKDAPMPAFELLEINNYNRLTVQTSRGCPHSCEFCASSVIISKNYKQKPAEKVLAEIDKIKEIWEHPFIEFADDNSVVNKAYWRELLPELIKRNIKWFTETDISVAEDEEILELMRKSGCAQVLIGLESPEKLALDGLEMRANWKMKRFDDYKHAIKKIQSHGITVNSSL